MLLILAEATLSGALSGRAPARNEAVPLKASCEPGHLIGSELSMFFTTALCTLGPGFRIHELPIATTWALHNILKGLVHSGGSDERKTVHRCCRSDVRSSFCFCRAGARCKTKVSRHGASRAISHGSQR